MSVEQHKQINNLRDHIKVLQRNLVEFSQNQNRSQNQYQQFHEYIKKIFLEDPIFDNKSWLELIYEHLLNTPQETKIYNQAQDNFLELIQTLSPKVEAQQQDKNIFHIVFGQEQKQATNYNFSYQYWPHHFQQIIFGGNQSSFNEYSAYINYYQSNLRRTNQQFQSGKMILSVQEYFLFSFMSGLSKMRSKSTKDVTFYGNLFTDQLFHSLTHNPYLILLQFYLNTNQGSILQFLVQEYLILQHISFYYQFDYMNELTLPKDPQQNNMQKHGSQIQNRLRQQSNLDQNSMTQQNFMNQQSQYTSNSMLQTNSYLQQTSQYNQDLQQHFHQNVNLNISVQRREFELPLPHIFQALQIFIYYQSINIYKDDYFRKLIFKFLYCCLNINQIEQGYATMNDISKLYLTYLFPTFSLFSQNIEQAHQKTQEILQNYSQKKSSLFTQITSQLIKSTQITKHEPYAFELIPSFNSSVQTNLFQQSNNQFNPNFNNSSGLGSMFRGSRQSGYDSNNQDDIYNNSVQMRIEFEGYFNQSQINDDSRYHQDRNVLFYTILFNKYIQTFAELKNHTSQDIFSLYNFMQFFEPFTRREQVIEDGMQGSQVSCIGMLFGKVLSYKDDQPIQQQYMDYSSSYQSSQGFSQILKHKDLPDKEILVRSLKEMNFDKNDNKIIQYFTVFNNEIMKDSYLKIQNSINNIICNIQNYRSYHRVNIDKIGNFNRILADNVQEFLQNTIEIFIHTGLHPSIQNRMPQEQYMRSQQQSSGLFQQKKTLSSQSYVKNRHNVFNFDTWELPIQQYEIYIIYLLLIFIATKLDQLIGRQPKQIKIKDQTIEVPGFGGLRKFARKDIWEMLSLLLFILVVGYYILSLLGSLTGGIFSGSETKKQQKQYNY